MRTILAQLKQYKKDSILTPLFTALEVIMEVMLPFITALIIDEGIQEGNMRKVYTYGGVMIVMAFISLISGAMAGKYAASASSGLACNLRKGVYDKVQDFSFSNIDKFSTAGLVTRMTTDVTNIQNAYQMCIRVAVRAPLMLVCSMVMSFMISPRLSMIFLGAILFLACILGIIMMAARKIFNVVFTKYDDLNAGVQENVSGIRVVKAYVREDYENQKFTSAAENLCRLFVQLFAQRQNSRLDGSQCGMEFQNGSDITFADLLFVISIAQECQRYTVRTNRRLDAVRHIFFILCLIIICHILAACVLVAGQVIIGSVRNAPQLAPAEREFIFDICCTLAVVRQFFGRVISQTDCILCHIQAQQEVFAVFSPVIQPFQICTGFAEEFQLHLFKFSGTEGKVTGCDFVTEGFTNLTDTEG